MFYYGYSVININNAEMFENSDFIVNFIWAKSHGMQTALPKM